jgi:hypothetical protein
MAIRVDSTRRVGGDAVERSMSADGVDDLLARCGFQCFGVGFREGGDRR